MASKRTFTKDVAEIAEQFKALMSTHGPQLESGKLVLQTIIDLLEKRGGSAPAHEIYKLRQEFLETEEALQLISNRALLAMELLRTQNKALSRMISVIPSQNPPPDKTR